MYDFRKIGEQNRYGMKRLDGSAELKVSRFLGRHYTVSLLGGVGYMMREETYKDYDYLIRNVQLTPSLGIGARYSGEKFDVELRGCWSHRRAAMRSGSIWKKTRNSSMRSRLMPTMPIRRSCIRRN